MRHIGVDLHKTNLVVCFLAADDTARTETYPLTVDGLTRFTRQLGAEDEMAVEATQNIYHFYDQVKLHVARVAVVDTYRFQVIARSKKRVRVNSCGKRFSASLPLSSFHLTLPRQFDCLDGLAR